MLANSLDVDVDYWGCVGTIFMIALYWFHINIRVAWKEGWCSSLQVLEFRPSKVLTLQILGRRQPRLLEGPISPAVIVCVVSVDVVLVDVVIVAWDEAKQVYGRRGNRRNGNVMGKPSCCKPMMCFFSSTHQNLCVFWGRPMVLFFLSSDQSVNRLGVKSMACPVKICCKNDP